MSGDPIQIVVLEGDETGQELLEQAVRVLDPELLEISLELRRFDLSLEHRRASSNEVVHQAAAAMRDKMAANYGKPADVAGATATANQLALKPESRTKVTAWAEASSLPGGLRRRT